MTVVLAKALMNMHFNPKAAELALEDYKPGDKLVPFKVVGEYKGTDLVGMEYEQLLPWVKPVSVDEKGNWEDASDKIAYSKRREYLQGYELDSVMNYPLKNAIINFIQTENTAELTHTIRLLIDHYPKQTLDCLMNILGTHDNVLQNLIQSGAKMNVAVGVGRAIVQYI